MNDYESEAAEWGLSQYDPYGIGLHHRIRHINAIEEKKAKLEDAQAYYNRCKEYVENKWSNESFSLYTTACWNLKVRKDELATLMSQ